MIFQNKISFYTRINQNWSSYVPTTQKFKQFLMYMVIHLTVTLDEYINLKYYTTIISRKNKINFLELSMLPETDIIFAKYYYTFDYFIKLYWLLICFKKFLSLTIFDTLAELLIVSLTLFIKRII